MKSIPNLYTEEGIHSAMNMLRIECNKIDAPVSLINWVKHKDSNPWILRALCPALSLMRKKDWLTSEYTTNIAESAHAYSQRTGKQLTLVGAILQAEKLDKQYFELQSNVYRFGVASGYGKKDIIGRADKNMNRQKGRIQKVKKATKSEQQSETGRLLMEAKELIESGVDAKVVEQFLKANGAS